MKPDHEIEGCRVTANRDPKRPRRWVVREPVTDLHIAEGRTRKEALEKARERIVRETPQVFHEIVARHTPARDDKADLTDALRESQRLLEHAYSECKTGSQLWQRFPRISNTNLELLKRLP